MFEKRNLDELTRELVFRADNELYRACLVARDCPLLNQCPELLSCLHPDELQYYNTLQFARRRRSYLLGKYTAKQATAGFLGEEKLQRIRIDHGVFLQPLVVHPRARDVQVSVTHTDSLGVAIAFSQAIPMGIDVERIYPHRQQVLESILTEKELGLVRGLSHSPVTSLTLVWTVKESLSKALKTGLLTPPHVFEINNITAFEKILLSKFSNFPQFTAVSFFFRDYVCSVTYPSSIDFPMVAIPALLASLDEVVSD